MPFDYNAFTKRLIAESLFYDEEYGAIGNVSLINEESAREVYIAYYIPEKGRYVIDIATEWEPYDEQEDADIGYAFASDTEEHASSKSLKEVAEELLRLAVSEELTPSVAILFEEEELS